MSRINFQKTYPLGADFEDIQIRAGRVLGKYLGYPGLYLFTDLDRSVTFTSERLVPKVSTGRPRIMLLFSNPHPLSVHQGMFLSPNTKGRESDFWPIMAAAGWLPIPKEYRTPGQLAEICLEARYPGPFELVFYCYYAFPTNDPTEIRPIFGKEYFKQFIGPEARDEFRKMLREESVEAVVTFNKGIFNLVSSNPVDRYIDSLEAGELIRGEVQGSESHVPVFQTFPTGWWRTPREVRIASLVSIREAALKLLQR